MVLTLLITAQSEIHSKDLEKNQTLMRATSHRIQIDPRLSSHCHVQEGSVLVLFLALCFIKLCTISTQGTLDNHTVHIR